MVSYESKVQPTWRSREEEGAKVNKNGYGSCEKGAGLEGQLKGVKALPFEVGY